jgi:hypothetical protein
MRSPSAVSSLLTLWNMADIEEIRRITREAFEGGESSEALEYITQEYVDEFEAAFGDDPIEGLTVVKEDGTVLRPRTSQRKLLSRQSLFEPSTATILSRVELLLLVV